VSDMAAISAHLRVGLGMVSVAAPGVGPGSGAAILAQALRDHAGLALPDPGCWVGDDALALLWCAPGQFLAVGDAEATQRLAGALRAQALLIDLTGSRVVVRLSGPSVRGVLARCVPLDLHPRTMRPGHVASTVAAHIGVQIWQIDALPSYDLAGPVSYAGSLLRALELAGAPVAGA